MSAMTEIVPSGTHVSVVSRRRTGRGVATKRDAENQNRVTVSKIADLEVFRQIPGDGKL